MKERVLVSLDLCYVKELDTRRGIIPRSAYIRRIVENEFAAVEVQDRQVPITNYGMAQNPQDGGAVNV